MPVIPTKTTYLEMFAPTENQVRAPRTDLRISRIDRPSVDFYRHLYRQVGSGLHWVDRHVMGERELESIIHHDQVDIFVLTDAEELAGYAELDRRAVPSSDPFLPEPYDVGHATRRRRRARRLFRPTLGAGTARRQ